MSAIYSGIKLAAQDATDGAEQVALDVLKDVFDQASIKAMFASINEQAVLAVLSRTRNDGLKVSDRIWRTSQNARNALTKMVEDAVTRGLNSRVLGRQVQQYLQPGVWTAFKDETRRSLKVSRDISMEAMRLAVTELHHAFHEGAVQSYRATPSYEGVYWRLSSNHPHTDICDTYAPHDGNGFWKEGDEPSKPHPWCRCVIVPRLEDTDQFVQRLRQWVDNPQSQPDIESWYNGLPRSFLRRPSRTVQIPIPGLHEGRNVPQYVRDVENRLARGARTLDDVLEIGDILRGELDRRIGELKRELLRTVKRRSQIAEQLDKNRMQGITADKQRLLDEYRQVEQRRRKAMEKLLDRPNLVRDILDPVRKMNDDTEIAVLVISDDEAVQRLKGQLRYLPKDWVDAFRGRQIFAKMSTERSYYQQGGMAETISLRSSASPSVTLHELTYRCEAWVPKLVQMEQAFYEYRTAGEPLKWLGPRYDPNEMTRFDRFTDSYMGKDYDGRFFELMSMGMEWCSTDCTNPSAIPNMSPGYWGCWQRHEVHGAIPMDICKRDRRGNMGGWKAFR
ncbi:hypothetical protein [Alicyclobacillus herbarius]|uniref:hypothetical protein n=1 Tax=Alicyclobacillus herbarius TaxID=122960 RepID=UPI000684660B|nr:hypothetical protein [Alicyclobacillus herbarius]